MRRLVTYCRMTLLAIALLSVPILAQAQMGARISRERDSLVNLISHETDTARLAVLHYQLAERYGQLNQNRKLAEAADKAVTYANKCKDYTTLYKSQIMLGENYMLNNDAVNAIQKYLSARGVLEKKYNEERKKYIDEQTARGVKQENIKELERSAADVEADADIVVRIGMVYFERGHYIHSIDDFSDALITYESIGADEKALNMKKFLAISYYKREDYESSLEYYEALLDVYKQRNDWGNTKMVYQRLNEIANAKKDYDKVLAYNKDLYNDCIAHNSIRESLDALNNVAYTYVCLGDHEKAAKYYQQLIDTDPKVSGDEHFMAGNYTNLGLCYQNMGNDAAAVENLKKAIELRQKYSQHLEGSTVENIVALIYLKNQDLHNAQYYADAAVRNARTCGDSHALMAAYQTYNKVLQEKGEYKEALNYYQQYLNIRDSAQLQSILDDRELSEDLRMLTEAETRYQEGLSTQERIELENERYKILAEAKEAELHRMREMQEIERQRTEEQARQRELELQNQLMAVELEREQLRSLQEKEAQEKVLQAQREEQARKQRELDDLKRDQEAQAQQLIIQKAEARNTRYALYLALVAILGTLAFLLVVRKKNSRLKAQQKEIEAKNETLQMKNDEIISINQEITKQKAVIEEANKSMTDSIVYAKRIQTAVSPDPSFLSKYHYDYFMFFRPRDIVSGDYYWFYSDSHKHVFIVAADCTGHGVPGAFMSMLGVSLFNKIVAERQILQPDLILNEMRNEVKSALHQDSINSSQKDGMDLSLVRIDLDTMMMHFAAANNNGYLLREYDEADREEISKDLAKPEHLRDLGNGKLLKMTIMPADAMPIGVYLREKESFTMTSYQLRPGDTFFLTSDGYVDQFGGKFGRKFLSRNFIKLLMDMHGKPMAEQEKIIVDTHDDWRGLEYDQLDDIIVIGVQV
ncbi:MAG: tetratricopeptide repeat protein [Bacteroidales bacterium]|nr:tetratricopeptide repeat protein [Bacteroidales bacterium]